MRPNNYTLSMHIKVSTEQNVYYCQMHITDNYNRNLATDLCHMKT